MKRSTLTPEEIHRMTNHRGWYYCSEFGVFHGFRFHENNEQMLDAWAGNAWGPFKTFGEAKRDAAGYFKTDIYYAKAALAEVRKTRKGDTEK